MAEQPKDTKEKTTAITPMGNVKALLEASRGAISSRLPRHLTADRLLKVALTTINKNPTLLEATRESLIAAVMQAAELGLEPGGALGEGYLVVYNNKVKVNGVEKWMKQVQFIPGYRGLITLARRSGEISTLYAEAVYKGDVFNVELGLEEKLEHKPNYDSEERDDPKHLSFAYAVAKFKDGSFQFVVMSRRQIDKIRQRSKSADSGPWVTDFEEMAKKTTIRRLSKALPLTVELAKAVELQGAAEAGDFTTIEGSAFELDAGAETRALVDEASSKTEGVKAAVAGKAREAAKANGKEKEPADQAATATNQPAPSTAQTTRMTEIFGLLGWDVGTQANWCKANAELTIDAQIAKLEKLMDDDSSTQQSSARPAATQAKPGPVAVEQKPKASAPEPLDANDWA